MLNVPFYKYHGTGNDFIIIDNRDSRHNGWTKEQVQLMCDRRFGIGADGLMLLNKASNFDFEMRYYNSDGAESSMCGNGGRCLVQFAYDMGMKKETYRFVAIDGPHDAHFDGQGRVKLKMKDVRTIRKYENDVVLDTGSPHYIRQVARVKEYPVLEEGQRIRYNSEFAQQGINVNFVEVADDGLSVRTYERGVENETLSCGTGVTACALVFATKKGVNRVDVTTPGGQLAVEFNKIDDAHFEDIWLCGPAVYVFEGMFKMKTENVS